MPTSICSTTVYTICSSRKKVEDRASIQLQASAFQLIGDKTWRVAYIQYSDRPKHYRICKADENLRNFHDPVDIKGVTGPQHGSFMRITKKEYNKLLKFDAEYKKNKK